MKTKLFILLCFAFMFGACTGDYIQPSSTENNSRSTRGFNPDICMTQDSVLQFIDANALNNVLTNVMNLESEEERFEYIRELVPGFVSLKEKYVRALEEVDSLVDTKEDLELFKQRHPEFYYANEGADCGIYLPMEEPVYAYVTPASGNLIIANQQINKIKTPSYQSLKEYGLTYSDSDKTITLEEFLSTPAIQPLIEEPYGTFIFTGDRVKEVPKGVMYSSGWIKNGKRKFKVEARRDIEKTSFPGGAYLWEGRLHVELSFRKKVAGSWINYSSRTESVISLRNIYESDFKVSPQQNRNGHSDHDIFLPIPCNVTLNAGNYCYTYPTLVCHANIKYQGFSDNMDFDWELAGAYCITDGKFDILKRWP